MCVGHARQFSPLLIPTSALFRFVFIPLWYCKRRVCLRLPSQWFGNKTTSIHLTASTTRVVWYHEYHGACLSFFWCDSAKNALKLSSTFVWYLHVCSNHFQLWDNVFDTNSAGIVRVDELLWQALMLNEWCATCCSITRGCLSGCQDRQWVSLALTSAFALAHNLFEYFVVLCRPV